MRLALVLPSLAGGGMERISMHLIQEWVSRGVDVDLVVSRLAGPLVTEVPSSVPIFEVAGRHPSLFPFGLRRYLNTRRPTHILSVGIDVVALTLLAVKSVRISIPTVVSFQIQLSTDLALKRGLERVKARLAIWLLRRLAPVCRGMAAVSHGVAEDVKHTLAVPARQVHIIYNPVITARTRERLETNLQDCPVPAGTPWVIYVGRLVYPKGIDVLMTAFQNVAARGPAHLVLLGEGPLRDTIAMEVASKGLQDRVHLVGFRDNPLPWIREADVLVLPSRNEGCPTVLIEAMACGTQIVATDCPSGPAEILQGGRYGQLVPVEDANALAEALVNALESRFQVAVDDLQARAEDFTVERAATLYEGVLGIRVRGRVTEREG